MEALSLLKLYKFKMSFEDKLRKEGLIMLYLSCKVENTLKTNNNFNRD